MLCRCPVLPQTQLTRVCVKRGLWDRHRVWAGAELGCWQTKDMAQPGQPETPTLRRGLKVLLHHALKVSVEDTVESTLPIQASIEGRSAVIKADTWEGKGRTLTAFTTNALPPLQT